MCSTVRTRLMDSLTPQLKWKVRDWLIMINTAWRCFFSNRFKHSVFKSSRCHVRYMNNMLNLMSKTIPQMFGKFGDSFKNDNEQSRIMVITTDGERTVVL